MSAKKTPIPAGSIIDFLDRGIQLKKIARQGWILKGIEKPESVADHTMNCCLLALVYARSEGLDAGRLVSLSLTHDIGESVIGDLIWERGRITNIKKQAIKHRDEMTAIREVLEPVRLTDVRRLVEEFLEQKTPEARAMKEIDKIEMVLQALAYEKEVEDPNSLVEFWESTAKYLKSDFAWGLFEELKRRSGITAPLPERPTR